MLPLAQHARTPGPGPDGTAPSSSEPSSALGFVGFWPPARATAAAAAGCGLHAAACCMPASCILHAACCMLLHAAMPHAARAGGKTGGGGAASRKKKKPERARSAERSAGLLRSSAPLPAASRCRVPGRQAGPGTPGSGSRPWPTSHQPGPGSWQPTD
jgi:hypothetical protein